MESELELQRRNHTRELISLPKSNKLVGFTWLFKLTRNEEGKIMEHKARVVAQGYAQRFGDDFEEVYAPLTRHATFRTFKMARRSGEAISSSGRRKVPFSSASHQSLEKLKRHDDCATWAFRMRMVIIKEGTW